MVARADVLNVMGRPRLLQVARELRLAIPARATKKAIVAEMAASRRFLTLDLLQRLTCRELAEICARANLGSTSGSRPVLMHRLTGDDRYLLRAKIVSALKKQGFRTARGNLIPPELEDKDSIRRLHELSVKHKRDKARPALMQHESQLLQRIAEVKDIDLDSLYPQLVEVHRGTEDELLFRYACLHWSIPVSSGYGRRLRFLITDRHNGKLIGVLGLGDPVYALSSRDIWIGFKDKSQRGRLKNIADAFVLGAVPPYSRLLCGKLVAMLAASNEVRERFREKYSNRVTVIGEERQDGELAILTTTSALGRSSIYNRLAFANRRLYIPVGYTQGYGDFQFLNGLYDDLFSYAKNEFVPTAKQGSWGGGFRNRREVVKKCLASVGLPENLLKHGVRRQVYVVPLAENSAAFLRGDELQLASFDLSVDSLFHSFKQRWLLPRIGRLEAASDFRRSDFALWE